MQNAKGSIYVQTVIFIITLIQIVNNYFMKFSFFLFFFIVFASNVLAQSGGIISGSVSVNSKPSEGATIGLLSAKDSLIVKLSATSKEGGFMFDEVAHGKYLVSVSAIGFQKAYSRIIDITSEQQNIQLPPFQLELIAQELTAVTVTAKRPLIENKIDRTIVNVDASPTNIGSSALEILEKSPGISVDKEGNISLKGKKGVMIMVDGRPTQLGGEDLANLLRSMNSNQLDQIEIMTNPPAKYDAAGNAGVINIKTKKLVTAGYNGSASVTYSQGKYSKTSESINLNYREGKVNLFTNLSHNYQKRFLTLDVDRNIYNTGGLEYVFAQTNERITTANSINAKIGADFFANKKSTFGAVLNLNSRPMKVYNPSTNNIYNSSKDLESVTNSLVTNEADWKSFNTNLNFKRVLNSKGEISADIDFVKYSSFSDQFMVNSYRDADGTTYKKADSVNAHLPQELEVYSTRVDYLRPMKKDTRFEAGIKSSIVRTENNARYDSIHQGNIITDVNRSNHFIYEETVHAAYVNLSTSLSKKLSAQFGLRLENTISKGKQETLDKDFVKEYTQLFPTAYLLYKADDNNRFGINFGKRVRRPGYQSLNPFIKLVDKYTYQIGNPDLKPSISNNFELSHNWKNRITTTLNYNYVMNVMSEITEQKGQETYMMPGNVSNFHQYGISLSANTPITKWWTSNIYVNAFKNNYKGVISNAQIDETATGFIINGSQQFKINKGLTAEFTGWYRNGGLEGGVIRVRSVGVVGAGISQQVLKNKGTIRFSARDIFHTQKLKGSSRYANVDYDIAQVSDTQVFSLGFTYSFSKGKKIAPVKRSSGSASEEQGRIEQ